MTNIGWEKQFYDDNMKKYEVPKWLPIDIYLNDWVYKFQQKENMNL